MSQISVRIVAVTMKEEMKIAVVILIVCLFQDVSSHLCLITPRQRGTIDIFQSGSPTCFRHTPPCGGMPPETPDISRTYKAGQTAYFQFQQNYNHYEPGYPGYMDLAIAKSPTSTDFQTLAVITDKYVHAQDHQHNYTVLVKIPDISCDQCVIRARYNAHKPGETPFLQCSDIKILQSSAADNVLRFRKSQQPPRDKNLVPLQRALRLQRKHPAKTKQTSSMLYGFGFNPFESDQVHFSSIDTVTGKINHHINKLRFGLDTYGAKTTEGFLGFMVDEVVVVDNYRNTTSIILHTSGGNDDVAKRLYTIGSTNGTLVQEADLFKFTGGAINALSWYVGESMAAIRLQEAADKPGSFNFEVGTLDYGGLFVLKAQLPQPEDLYINFQWLETDVNSYHLVYALMGNENAPDKLNARIYTFDIYKGAYVGHAELDVSAFTFMSMHSYKGSSTLFAFSPGLWGSGQYGWYLVAVDPQTGSVTRQCDIAPLGVFERYYGGSVYQGYSKDEQLLYHVLRVAGSDVDFIVSVNPMTCDVSFSEATNLRHMHSIQSPRPGSVVKH